MLLKVDTKYLHKSFTTIVFNIEVIHGIPYIKRIKGVDKVQMCLQHHSVLPPFLDNHTQLTMKIPESSVTIRLKSTPSIFTSWSTFKYLYFTNVNNKY